VNGSAIPQHAGQPSNQDGKTHGLFCAAFKRNYCLKQAWDSAVNAISLADGTVTTNVFPDELCKTIHEILVVQQLA
jgi:hypothetical protein